MLYMIKEISEGDKSMKTQLYVSNDNDDKITEKLFKHDGFFGDQNSDLTLEKANFPENLLCYANQATISPLKNNQEAIYVVNVALAQIVTTGKFSNRHWELCL